MGRARRQPLIFVITTAGDNLEGVCWEQHEYARMILSGDVIATRYYPLIYACTAEELEGDKIFDRALWRKANPSIGHTIDEEEFGRDLIEAMQSPRSKASFLRYSFNVWSQSITRWLDAETWRKCERAKEFPRGSQCFGGLDLAKISDMTSLALIFSERLDKPVARIPTTDQAAPAATKDEKRYHHKAWFWIPESRVSEIEKENPALHIREWIAKGFVTVTPGNVTDYATIKRDIVTLSKHYNIERIAFDPWNAESLTQDLESQGIDRVEFRQTMANYAHPTSEFERLLRAELLTHDPNPVLDWQARNVTVLSDASGNFRPVKPPHEDHRKIDGIVSGIMGLNEAMLAPPPFSGSPLIM
jgi:phage terminase large subunit-like protein